MPASRRGQTLQSCAPAPPRLRNPGRDDTSLPGIPLGMSLQPAFQLPCSNPTPVCQRARAQLPLYRHPHLAQDLVYSLDRLIDLFHGVVEVSRKAHARFGMKIYQYVAPQEFLAYLVGVRHVDGDRPTALFGIARGIHLPAALIGEFDQSRRHLLRLRADSLHSGFANDLQSRQRGMVSRDIRRPLHEAVGRLAVLGGTDLKAKRFLMGKPPGNFGLTFPSDWKASSTTSAPTRCAFSTIAFTSLIYELRKTTWEIGTSKVSSSIASSKRSVGTWTPSSVLTICTRAPRSRCASQKYMTDGKFMSLYTTLFRRLRKSN